MYFQRGHAHCECENSPWGRPWPISIGPALGPLGPQGSRGNCLQVLGPGGLQIQLRAGTLGPKLSQVGPEGTLGPPWGPLGFPVPCQQWAGPVSHGPRALGPGPLVPSPGPWSTSPRPWGLGPLVLGPWALSLCCHTNPKGLGWGSRWR